ncbi:MAG: aspartate/glutamate racemase family protein [Acidimicrobiales bacterium]
MGVAADPAPGAHLGVVDWGIGGLGLVRALDELLPSLPITYWSDTGAAPYGLVPTAALAARLRAVVGELASRGCTEVVLACNAASTVAPRLTGLAVPVTGIIGAGIAAVPTGADRVGVVGGRRTIASGAYRRGLSRPGRTVASRVAQPLSAHIEAGRTGSAGFAADLRHIVAPLRAADAVVLACTHYPAATAQFAAALPGVELVDPAGRLALDLCDRLGGRTSEAAGGPSPAPRTHLTTGDPAAMRRAAHLAWSVDVDPGPVRLAGR